MFCSKIRAYTFLQPPPPPAPYRLAFPMIFHGLGVDIFWSLKLAEEKGGVFLIVREQRTPFNFFRPKNLDFKYR